MRRSSRRLRDLALTLMVAMSLVLIPPAAPAHANSSCTYAEWGTYQGASAAIGIGWSGYVPDQWSFAIKAPGSGGTGTIVATATRSSPVAYWDTTRWANSYYDFTIISGRSTWYYPCGIRVLNVPTAPSPVIISPVTNSVDVFDASWGASSIPGGVAYYEYFVDCYPSRALTTPATGARLTGQAVTFGTHRLCVRAVDRAGNRGPANSASFTYSAPRTILRLSTASPWYARAAATIDVVLTDQNGRPLATRAISLNGWGSSAYATTDVSGRASVRVAAPSAPGTYAITASFLGDTQYQRSDAQQNVLVIRDAIPPTAPQGLAVAPPRSFTNAFTASWSASQDNSGTVFYRWGIDRSPASGTTSTSTAVRAPSLGQHTFTLLAQDATGNTSPTVSTSFVYERAGSQFSGFSADSPVPVSTAMNTSVVLLDQSGRPLAGRYVSFYADWGAAGQARTDASGRASTSLNTPSVPGTYGLRAIFYGDGTYPRADATRSVVVERDSVPPPVPTGVFVTPASSSVNLFDAGWNYSYDRPGVPAAFYEYRIDSGAIQRAYGARIYRLTAASVGRHTFEVRAVDSSGNASAFASTSFELRPAAATLTVLAPTSAARCTAIDLSARLASGATPLAGRAITFALGGASATATTDAQGIARASIRYEGATGAQAVTARFHGDTTTAAAQAGTSMQITGDATRSCQPGGGGPPGGGTEPPGGGTEPPGGGQGGPPQTQGGLSVDIPPR